MNTTKYFLPNGEEVRICYNEGTNKYVAYKPIGPIKCHLYVENTEEEVKNKLAEDYHGFEDKVNPHYIRHMFEKWFENKYPFDVAKSAILEFEDLDDNEKWAIRDEIMGFVKAMNKCFHTPYVEDTYYPYGIEVTLQQLADLSNGRKKN